MIEFLKLVFVFAVIVIGIRKKIFVGYILFGAGLLTAILYGANPMEMLDGYKNLLISRQFLQLYAIIILITFLGRILKEIGYLDRLVKISEELVGGARTASGVLPGLIGLMPMPGGALLSAPLVGRVLTDPKYTAEFKTTVNYWSRHVMEFCWPVYPGLVLSAAITGLPIGTISILQLPMTFIMIPIGIFFFIRKISIKNKGNGHFFKPFGMIIFRIWPILLAILIYAVTNLELVYAVLISLILLLIVERPPMAAIREVGKAGHYPRFLHFGTSDRDIICPDRAGLPAAGRLSLCARSEYGQYFPGFYRRVCRHDLLADTFLPDFDQ